MTVKSDDVVGRVKTYEAIIKGDNIPEPGIPESFKVLLKELQSLSLDIKILSENGEVRFREDIDDEGDMELHLTEEEFIARNENAAKDKSGDYIDDSDDLLDDFEDSDDLLISSSFIIESEDDDDL